MRRFSTLILALASLFSAAALTAAERPAVGDKAADFSLQSLDGEIVQLSEMTGDGPVVLVVLRGYPGYQCPACNRQVQDFISEADGFSEAGATVIMVYPGPDKDLLTRAQEFTADKQFPDDFYVLLDPGYKFTNLYGLRWDAPSETAYPSTFLLDEEGIIFFAKISDSHGGRTTAAEVIEEMKKQAER